MFHIIHNIIYELANNSTLLQYWLLSLRYEVDCSAFL
jgi:hypothetical protein